ncbi:MAG: hypothetical protein CSA62_05875 [Planctomycetota bacterium]|nr:MAG: hypothetical protein CSA62_05875 [Planctomycetota bacterium]
MLQGYPFYDLIRIAESMNFSARALRREILKHTKVLGIDARDAEAHLLSSLGHIGLNRGGFPLERYAELSLRCFTRFQHALNPEF